MLKEVAKNNQNFINEQAEIYEKIEAGLTGFDVNEVLKGIDLGEGEHLGIEVKGKITRAMLAKYSDEELKKADSEKINESLRLLERNVGIIDTCPYTLHTEKATWAARRELEASKEVLRNILSAAYEAQTGLTRWGETPGEINNWGHPHQTMREIYT